MMRNLLAKLPKKLLALFAVFIVSAALSTVAMAAFGPDRPTKVWTVQENGFDYVTFNSYTEVPGIGDERNFLQGVVSGRDSEWADPVSDVTNNDTITAKIYIHNNADPLLNEAPGKPGVARDVKVSIDIPTGLDDEHEVKSSIQSSNAKPTVVYDTLDIDSINDSLFQLAYVPGSAKLAGETLSDKIFSEGIDLEDQKGCFEFVREITFEMKIEKPGYQIQKTARIKGEDSSQWRKVVNAERGDSIEWRISFQNIGSTRLDDVTIVDDLPSYTEVVPGSVEVVNAAIPGGYKYDDSAIQDNGDTVNVNIEDYAPGANAFLYLETKIEDHEDIRCGTYQIANVAYVTPKGLGTLNDNAKVNIVNTEECAEPIVACDTLNSLFVSGPVKSGTTVKYSVGFTAIDVSVDSIVFKVNGVEVQNSSSADFEYTPTAPGTYTITAVLMTSQGPITSAACEDELTVEETEDPIYACEQFKLKKNDRKITVSFVPVALNGATFKDAEVVYSADGIKQDAFTTNKLTDDSVITSYTFDEEAKNIKAVATVRFNVSENNKTVVKEVTCRGSAVLGDVVENCVIPGKEHLPKDSEDCVVTEIPNTGAGSLAGMLTAVTAVGAVAHRRYTLKRQ